MPLQTVGTTTCPECQTVQRVFRRSYLDRGRPIYAISLHFLGDHYCPGEGKRVTRAAITPLERTP